MPTIYTVEIDGKQYDIEGDRPPTEAEARAAVGAFTAPPQTVQQQPPAAQAPARGMLPMAGGFVGSLVGTVGGVPGRIAGAGVGGAIGKGAELFLDDKDDTFTDSLAAMGLEGGKQAGLEAAGGLLGKGLKYGGSRLYQSVLKPSRALRAEFPTVVDDAINAGVSVGRRGAEKAGQLVSQAGAATRAVLERAEAAGAKAVNMRPVVKELSRTTRKVAQQPLREADTATVRTIRDQVLKENPTPISLTTANEMKQAAQRVAQDGYKKIAGGADINSVALDANMDIARGLRRSIERRVPETASLNRATQRAMGVSRAADEALGRIENNNPLGMSTLIASGTGLATGLGSGDAKTGAGTSLAIFALANPAIASRLAIAAAKGAPWAQYAPQVGRAAILSQLLNAEASAGK